MSTVYLIRCQGAGVIPDRVYLRPPTLDELKGWLAYELERHGIDKDGKPRMRWVMSQEAEAHGDDSFACEPWDDAKHTRRVEGMLDEETVMRILTEKGASPSSDGVAESETPKIAMHGTGSVVNPGEPGYVPGGIGRVQQEREAMTLTAADIGVMDLGDDEGT